MTWPHLHPLGSDCSRVSLVLSCCPSQPQPPSTPTMQPEDSKSWKSCCDRMGQGQVWGQEMGYFPREHPGAYLESCPKVRKMLWPPQPDPRQSAAPRTLASGRGKGHENKHEVKKDCWSRAGLFFLRKRQRGWDHLCPERSGGGLARSPSPDDHRSWARPCSWPWPWPPSGPCRVGGAAGRGTTLVYGSPRPASLGNP